MAQATVKTVQYIDPRIEPQPDPVYDYVIGPTQNQFYQIPASAKSDSYIAFNNLTTLGVDRAYLDTFEIELEVDFSFKLAKQKWQQGAGGAYSLVDDTAAIADDDMSALDMRCFTFQSWPFNTCCDEARVNINGGAFFSQPMSYVRAKERYMNQWELAKCYANVCPCHRPLAQYESARTYSGTLPDSAFKSVESRVGWASADGIPLRAPTRYGFGTHGCHRTPENNMGGTNNSIIRLGAPLDDYKISYTNLHREDTASGKYIVMKVRWREPLFVSPFSSKYDASYGRPLYNITSMDLAFTMMNLGNMVRFAWGTNQTSSHGTWPYVSAYSAHIVSAKLCYQVMTIPNILNKPLTTLVPYRRFVPYITEYNQQGPGGGSSIVNVAGTGQDTISLSSGVYTLNEIPTAIWVFLAPTKDRYQTNAPDEEGNFAPPYAGHAAGGPNGEGRPSWDSNKLFGYMTHISISMANTTQILSQAKPEDLYRIAKANGCQDSFYDWAVYDGVSSYSYVADSGDDTIHYPMHDYYGPGSVLRLKPGVDIIVPDQPLIPGANANNMVFQVAEAQFVVPPHSSSQTRYALWLLFEYVGVAAISPGQCEITMNPLGSGEIMAVSPVMSATSESTEGEVEGSGVWDKVKKGASIAARLADSGLISRLLKQIPGAEKAAQWAETHGLGAPAIKRGRSCGGAVSGGAVIGKGLNDWL